MLHRPAALFLFFFILLNTISAVRAQELPSSQQLINYAENEINNFDGWSKDYWFNVTTKIMFDSFSDVSNARRNINVAKTLVEKNETLALDEAARAAFEAKRANYRLFVFMTSRLLEDADKTLNEVPTYIAKPADTVATYESAVSLCRMWNISGVFLGYSGQPEQAWVTMNQMENSVRQLWWNKDSVANLAKSVKQQVIAYLAEWSPIYERQIKNAFIYSIVPTLLIVGAILIFIVTRFSSLVYGWARRTLRLPRRWTGEFDKKENAVILAPGVTLTYAGFQLANTISQLSTENRYFALWFLALGAGFIGLSSLIFGMTNLFKPRRATAIGAVSLVIIATLLYMVLAISMYSLVFK